MRTAKACELCTYAAAHKRPGSKAMTIKGFTADDSNVNAICCFPVRLAFPKQLYMKAAMLTLLPCLMRNARNLVNGSSCCCFAFAAPNATKRKGNQTLQRIVSVCCFSATIRIGVKAAQDSAGREAECHANIRWRGTQATAKGDIEMETTEQLTPITQTDSVIKKAIHATLDTPASAERALRSRLRRPTETVIVLGNSSLPEFGNELMTDRRDSRAQFHSLEKQLDRTWKSLNGDDTHSLFTKVQGRNFIKIEQSGRAVFL